MIARLSLFVCVTLFSALALAASYGPLVPERSSIRFVSKQMGVPVEGWFRRFTGQLNFDPTRPEVARARIEVELASIDAGSSEANDEVAGKDWFFVRNFPVARFEMRRVKILGNGRFEVHGALSVKNVTREMVTLVAFRQDAGLGIFEGSFILKRLEFGIGEGVWGDPNTVADEVQVNFVLAAKPVAVQKK